MDLGRVKISILYAIWPLYIILGDSIEVEGNLPNMIRQSYCGDIAYIVSE